MATSIYSNNDGFATHYGSSWVDARSGTPANSASHISNAYAIRIEKTSGRGAATWIVARSFMTFDVSSITHVPSKVLLYIQGNVNSTSDVMIVKATYSGSVSASEFLGQKNASTAHGLSDGSGAGTFVDPDTTDSTPYPTAYIDSSISWSRYLNTITLNQDARNDICYNSTFQICLMNYSYDYLDIDPPATLPPFSNVRSGMKFSDSSSSNDPYMDIFDAGNAIRMGTNF